MAALLDAPPKSTLSCDYRQRDNALLRGEASLRVVRVLQRATQRWALLQESARQSEHEAEFNTSPDMFAPDRAFAVQVRLQMEERWAPPPYDFSEDE